MVSGFPITFASLNTADIYALTNGITANYCEILFSRQILLQIRKGDQHVRKIPTRSPLIQRRIQAERFELIAKHGDLFRAATESLGVNQGRLRLWHRHRNLLPMKNLSQG